MKTTRKFQLKQHRSIHHLKITADSYPTKAQKPKKALRSGLAKPGSFSPKAGKCSAGEETAEKGPMYNFATKMDATKDTFKIK